MATRQPARKPYYEIHQATDRSWYFDLKGANHEIVVHATGYNSRANAAAAIQWTRHNAATADGP